MFSISAMATAASSDLADDGGISVTPAICAARQRRSPAMIHNVRFARIPLRQGAPEWAAPPWI